MKKLNLTLIICLLLCPVISQADESDIKSVTIYRRCSGYNPFINCISNVFSDGYDLKLSIRDSAGEEIILYASQAMTNFTMHIISQLVSPSHPREIKIVYIHHPNSFGGMPYIQDINVSF